MPHTLESERLWLRPFKAEDARALYPLLEGHPEVWRYDPGYQRTPQQRARLIRRYSAENHEDGCGVLALVSKAGGELLGLAGLQLYVLPTRPQATPEVGLFYKLGRPYWGQGYAGEACRALIDFAFTEMHLARLTGIAAAANAPSLRLMQRLGMRLQPAPPGVLGDVLGILENEQDATMQANDWVKIEIFIPEEFVARLSDALADVDVGHIGNYDHCMSVMPVRGYWRPLPGANPYLGTVGAVETGSEAKVEVNCRLSRVAEALKVIRAIHPYEEPVINIVPLLNAQFEGRANGCAVPGAPGDRDA